MSPPPSTVNINFFPYLPHSLSSINISRPDHNLPYSLPHLTISRHHRPLHTLRFTISNSSSNLTGGYILFNLSRVVTDYIPDEQKQKQLTALEHPLQNGAHHLCLCCAVCLLWITNKSSLQLPKPHSPLSVSVSLSFSVYSHSPSNHGVASAITRHHIRSPPLPPQTISQG